MNMFIKILFSLILSFSFKLALFAADREEGSSLLKRDLTGKIKEQTEEVVNRSILSTPPPLPQKNSLGAAFGYVTPPQRSPISVISTSPSAKKIRVVLINSPKEGDASDYKEVWFMSFARECKVLAAECNALYTKIKLLTLGVFTDAENYSDNSDEELRLLSRMECCTYCTTLLINMARMQSDLESALAQGDVVLIPTEIMALFFDEKDHLFDEEGLTVVPEAVIAFLVEKLAAIIKIIKFVKASADTSESCLVLTQALSVLNKLAGSTKSLLQFEEAFSENSFSVISDD